MIQNHDLVELEAQSRIHTNKSAQHRDWMKTVPNDGLIYYTSFLNAPRVLVTSPDALREVLSQKSYEFIKPGMIIQGIGRILGIGV